jgi:hypothetical protein
MSKSSFKKFNKTDYWNDEEEDNYNSRSRYLEKKQNKLVEKALKTKDISILTDSEFEEYNNIENMEIYNDFFQER